MCFSFFSSSFVPSISTACALYMRKQINSSDDTENLFTVERFVLLFSFIIPIVLLNGARSIGNMALAEVAHLRHNSRE